MTKNIKLFAMSMLAMGSLLTACNDDDSVDYTEYYGWRDQNNALADAFLSDFRTQGSDAYFTDTIRSNNEPWALRSTMYRVIRTANEDSLRRINRWITPLYTSTLKVHYTLYDTKSVMEYFEDNNILTDRQNRTNAALMNKVFFDPSCKADTLESKQVEFFDNFTAGSVITGWGDALQTMHIGDSWLLFIPWYLAYGQTGSGKNIDPYTNLFFRLELVDITEYGAPLPSEK